MTIQKKILKYRVEVFSQEKGSSIEYHDYDKIMDFIKKWHSNQKMETLYIEPEYEDCNGSPVYDPENHHF